MVESKAKQANKLVVVALGLAVGCVDATTEDGLFAEGTGTGIYLPDASDDDAPGLDDSGASTDAGTGAPGDDGPRACEEQTLQLRVEVPQVMLLLDKSYSMVDNEWDHDDHPITPPVTRWHTLYRVVDTLTHEIEDDIDLGMMLFPTDALGDNLPATACLVDAQPNTPVGPSNANAVVNAMPGPGAVDLFGGTPVSAGMMVVLDHLAEIEDGRPQYVVLVTDGAANCMEGTTGVDVFTEYDENLAPLLAEAYASGIATYVVGVDIVDEVGVYPEANPYERLNEIAIAGGVPRPGEEAFYNTTSEESLFAALDEIASQLGCSLELETAAQYPDQVMMWVGDTVVPRVDACEPEGEGWRFVQNAAPFTSIELCPASCEKAHEEQQLSVDYTCLPSP